MSTIIWTSSWGGDEINTKMTYAAEAPRGQQAIKVEIALFG